MLAGPLPPTLLTRDRRYFVVASANLDVFHIRDGKVTRLVLYWDRERAFAELGLGEPQ